MSARIQIKIGSFVALIGAILFFGAAFSLPVLAQGGTTHVVQPGDTLAQLAARYGVTVEALVEANGIENRDLIRVGQELTIPTAGAAVPAATPPPSPPAGEVFTVQPGDTLAALAAQYGVTVNLLVDANQIADRDLIEVGQVLTIPAAGAALPTPRPDAAGGPLQLEWSLVDWQADDPDYIGTIQIEASGGQPPYTYYHDGLLQDGARFDMAWRRCRPKPGSVGVVDAAGTRVQEDYWLQAPYCPVGIAIVSPEEGEHLQHLPRHFNLRWEHTVEAPPSAYGIEIEVWSEDGYQPWQEYRHERGDSPLFFVPDPFPGDVGGRVRMWSIYAGSFAGPKTPWRTFEFRVTY